MNTNWENKNEQRRVFDQGLENIKDYFESQHGVDIWELKTSEIIAVTNLFIGVQTGKVDGEVYKQEIAPYIQKLGGADYETQNPDLEA